MLLKKRLFLINIFANKKLIEKDCFL